MHRILFGSSELCLVRKTGEFPHVDVVLMLWTGRLMSCLCKCIFQYCGFQPNCIFIYTPSSTVVPPPPPPIKLGSPPFIHSSTFTHNKLHSLGPHSHRSEPVREKKSTWPDPRAHPSNVGGSTTRTPVVNSENENEELRVQEIL